MHGEYPVASMADFLEITSIKELSPEKVEVKKALSVALADLKTLDAEAKAIRAASDEAGLFDVVAMMEDQCGEFQKTIWFIESMLA
jgi:starvation-inducible DNA-binding protein